MNIEINSAPYIILGYRQPAPFNNLKTGTAASTLGYFRGWTGNGWGKERDTDSEAGADALPYATEGEAFKAWEMAQTEASIKAPLMRVMVVRKAADAEGLPRLLAYS